MNRTIENRANERGLFAILFASVLLAVVGFGSIGRCSEFPPVVGEFLEQHCHACHADGAAEGGLDLRELSRDLQEERALASWIRLYDRVQNGEMPPSDVEAPSAEQRRAFSDALQVPLSKAHQARKSTVLRRLNRAEYQNTMNDLFGTRLDLAELLPEDTRSHEFDNVGEALSLSMVQLQRYLEAADLVLDSAIAAGDRPAKSETVRASYADTRGAEKFLGSSWLKLPDGAVVFFRSGGYPSGMLREANARESGWYKIRVHGYAYQSERPVTFAIGATTFARGAERPTFAYSALPPGPASTVEVEAWMEPRYMVELTPQGIADRNNEIRKNGIANYAGPGLAVQYVELEGPLYKADAERGHRLLFSGLDRRELDPRNPADKRRGRSTPRYEIVSNDPAAEVTPVLVRVASAAHRRPRTTEDVTPYVDLFLAQLRDGEPFENALRTAVTAILCSPEFLYLRESDGRLDGYALASRLSYFLTRTLPDEPLLAAARDGSLAANPQVLLAHTERLLNHPHHARFVHDFTDAWLNLRDIEFTSPDVNLYPEYDLYLQYSMLQETRRFFQQLVAENLPVDNLVKADFTFLNERLASHYEIPGIEGPELRSVKLPAGSPRGGLLAQASVLKVSANGTSTSPVVRGVWVTERILGITPPPPPPGVAGVEPDIRGATTLREQLAKHRDLDSCRNCHAKIDPPGFALESFDPIGGWRDRFRSLRDGQPVQAEVNGRKVRYKLGPEVDASGELVDGRSFAGFVQFRDLLARDPELLTRTLATKMLVFATGREMGFSDRELIDRMVVEAAERQYGIRDLIRQVVTSEIFRSK